MPGKADNLHMLQLDGIFNLSDLCFTIDLITRAYCSDKFNILCCNKVSLSCTTVYMNINDSHINNEAET